MEKEFTLETISNFLENLLLQEEEKIKKTFSPVTSKKPTPTLFLNGKFNRFPRDKNGKKIIYKSPRKKSEIKNSKLKKIFIDFLEKVRNCDFSVIKFQRIKDRNLFDIETLSIFLGYFFRKIPFFNSFAINDKNNFLLGFFCNMHDINFCKLKFNFDFFKIQVYMKDFLIFYLNTLEIKDIIDFCNIFVYYTNKKDLIMKISNLVYNSHVKQYFSNRYLLENDIIMYGSLINHEKIIVSKNIFDKNIFIKNTYIQFSKKMFK